MTANQPNSNFVASATVRNALINRIPVLLPLLLCLGNDAVADTYVLARKYYLVTPLQRNVKTGAEAASLTAKAYCGGHAINCSGAYVSESYSDSAASWWWTGIMYYAATPDDPPTPTTVLTPAQMAIGSFVTYECPSGFTKYADKAMPGVCVAADKPVSSPPPLDSDACECSSNSPGEEDSTNPTAGNPIEISTAAKRQVETDYLDPTGSLSFSRIYRSDTNRWEFSYQMAAGNIQQTASPYASRGANCLSGMGGIGGAYCYPYISITADKAVMVRRPGGAPLYFNTSNSLLPAADVNDRIAAWTDNGEQVGWTVVNGLSDAVEKYNMLGLLMEIRNRNGRVKTFVYSDLSTPATIAPDAGYLLRVTDAFGRTLSFTYDANGLLHTMTDPAGQVYIYDYGVARTLSSVTYPGGKVKRYLYNESANINYGVSLPFALTGIVDENESRFATFRYNVDGTAISTEHALGAEKYTVSYTSGSTFNTVTDPLGAVRTYFIKKPATFRKAAEIRQPSADGASTVPLSMTYDANGNLATYTDFNGNVTKYTYDLARNLPLTKVSAFGTTSAITTTTVWDTRWRLPARIAEPKRITTYTYDDNANVLSKVIQPTTDATGASGMSATAAGVAQVWSYTYNALSQMLTVKGPRTDVDDTTTFTYDAQGNLTSETDALGHTTTYSNHDPAGRVGRIVDPNGLATDFSYTPRGWLASRTTGSESTSFEYDGVGQLTKVTLPNGSQLSYIYDAAHRLTQVTDSLGNSITYTLDAKGNQKAVQAADANGILARKVAQVFNVLGQLKSRTGGMQ
ncbi:RHS repeat protein [Duganella radicis]|uniref:Teneurin-like YD-shell domain-containing protein n=1 Tax=Duganella radicis TaxID=551988 RepID=A0A6L6PBL6_9BURK|nr:RHS repeat protein [Duganella radicis]MTV36233.1 hypothetical protein [Duganella radicis]